jgi:hypothetical protein
VIGATRPHGFDPATGEVEIGWTFLGRRYWGGRYNGEMKRLMLAHAFRHVARVVFLIDPANLRSQRAVMELGAGRAGIRRVTNGGRPLWELAAAGERTGEASPESDGVLWVRHMVCSRLCDNGVANAMVFACPPVSASPVRLHRARSAGTRAK